MDLFDQRAPIDSNAGEDYGSSGDMKKTQYMLQLLGTPWDPDTLKCIIIAAEQGMEMNSGFLDTLNNEQDTSAYRDIFEFGTIPGLKESDYYLAGISGILDFINARGLGYSLIPKNVSKAAEQDYWIDVAINEAQPQVKVLIQERIIAPMKNASYSVDKTAESSAKETLSVIFDALDKQIGNNQYISEKYSLADIHWLALTHLMILSESAEFVAQYRQIQRWYQSFSSRKSNCGQDIVPFSLLPTLDHIHKHKLSNVQINDF